MKDVQQHMQLIPDGGEVTVGELREMATRQQHQIESQQQLLVAREQRLKYLKQQEGRSAHISMEAERLKRLKERVEAQESKLRRLRALRGQVDNSRVNAASLSSDLDAMRHLFSEKEKELVDAVSKVEELTRQLEDIRTGRVPSGITSNQPSNIHLQKHHQELDKLRRELLYRNSVNREASVRVTSQRDALTNRKEDIARIDTRIAELQQRLHRKRLLNQQLASQISAATQAKQAQLKAVQQRNLRDGKKENSVDNAALDDNHSNLEDLAEFERGKHDPKYQTLPYNTKFSSANKGGVRGPYDSDTDPYTANDIATQNHTLQNSVVTSANPLLNNNGGLQPQHSHSASLGNEPPLFGSSSAPSSGVMTRTVHSIPTHLPSKAHASAPPTVTSSSLVRAQVNATRSASTLSQPSNGQHPEELPKSTSHSNMPQINSSTALLDARAANLPPTSLSISFAQKMSSASAVLQNRPVNKDVENVRALGYPAGSMQHVTCSSSNTNTGQNKVSYSGMNGPSSYYPGEDVASNNKQKPSLPPKPPLTKPTPPPRQKGDPMASSTESINLTGVAKNTSQSSRPQRLYASQNVIVSTYTQHQQSKSQYSPVTSKANSTNQQPPQAMSASVVSKGSNQEPEKSQSAKESVGDVHVSFNKRIGLPPDFLFPEGTNPPSDLLASNNVPPPSDLLGNLKIEENSTSFNKPPAVEDTTDRVNNNNSADIVSSSSSSTIPVNGKAPPETMASSEETNNNHKEQKHEDKSQMEENKTNQSAEDHITPTSSTTVVRRIKKGNLKSQNSCRIPRRVSFDPLALLLDASLEGELELVQRTASEVPNPSAANDEGITALHNAICAGHLDIVTFLVTFGCDVNAQDSDGWTPLHCAASCNNVAMVRFLVEHGACVLATTLSDHETAAEKCEQDEEGYDGCSQYLYNVQEKLGIMNNGTVYAVYDYSSQNEDEMSLQMGDSLSVIRRGDEYEREWWWVSINQDNQGYVPRNLLGLYPRVRNNTRPS